MRFTFPPYDALDAYNPGASATVGIRDNDGEINGRNLRWSYNQAGINDGEAIFSSPVPVPAPGTLLLLGAGLAGLTVVRRRFMG